MFVPRCHRKPLSRDPRLAWARSRRCLNSRSDAQPELPTPLGDRATSLEGMSYGASLCVGLRSPAVRGRARWPRGIVVAHHDGGFVPQIEQAIETALAGATVSPRLMPGRIARCQRRGVHCRLLRNRLCLHLHYGCRKLHAGKLGAAHSLECGSHGCTLRFEADGRRAHEDAGRGHMRILTSNLHQGKNEEVRSVPSPEGEGTGRNTHFIRADPEERRSAEAEDRTARVEATGRGRLGGRGTALSIRRVSRAGPSRGSHRRRGHRP